MKDIGECTIIGGFSTMEFLVVSSIIKNVLKKEGKMFCSTNIQCLDIASVHAIYNIIHSLTQDLHVELALYPRTKEDIHKLSKKFMFKCEIMYQCQM